MAQYKCISCGKVIESDNPCACDVCGYNMFEMPYNRSDILRGEISKFLLALRLTKDEPIPVSYYRTVLKIQDGKDIEETVQKEKDDKRFPSIAEIQKYVCSAEKIEVFCERLERSLEQINKHIHTPYKQNYKGDTSVSADKIETFDTTLNNALQKLDINVEPAEVVLPEIKLDYNETPDSVLINYADELLSLLDDLVIKVKKFIKQNYIYGTAYQKKHSTETKLKENEGWPDLFERIIKDVKTALNKNYVVDIFSDGSDELDDMLKTVWKGTGILLNAPVLSAKHSYLIGSTVADELSFGEAFVNSVNNRYFNLDAILNSGDFLSNRTEEELFKLYNAIIQLDSFGILNISKDALLQIGKSENELNSLIGLSSIKESIQKIKAYAISNKDSGDLNIHMCFLGNPGSGKTEVARYIAGILYENKILPTNNVVEVDRSGLVSQYFGATSEKTKQVINRAMGGVLFVDEAYALGNNSDHGITDYGKEAIDTLVKAMEDYRGQFCVIFAGYKNEMEKMLQINPGMASRIQFKLDFPNYSRDELGRIMNLMLTKRKYKISDDAFNRILDITDVKRKEPNFANARELRNIIDQVIMCQNLRVLGSDDKMLALVDVNKYIKDSNIILPISGTGSHDKIQTGDEELDALIGLDSVKKMIKKIKAYAKRNADDSAFNMHMCFYGNPGTGKTEVARILSRILYDAGVLKEAKLVETDSKGLLGKYVGETGPKTEAKVQDAMGGVLFIDEAYALTVSSSGTTNYGDEAIAVLLKDMEDYRGKFCTILAGYKNEMQMMISSNPGFESRIQFTLEFPDYTREELGEIAIRFLNSKKYTISDDALNLLLDVTEYYRNRPNFANARTTRNILDQVIMNQNLRTDEDDDCDRSLIITDDVKEYIDDENIKLDGSARNPHTIGFI